MKTGEGVVAVSIGRRFSRDGVTKHIGAGEGDGHTRDRIARIV